MSDPRVSIIITTRNRAEHLRETLASLQRLQVPADLPVELLVVDNASTDGTAEVIKTTRLPRMPVHYLHEPKPGQSNARNSGMANTTSEVILFTDDDVRAPMDWIEAMATPILGGKADAVAGGVRIAPQLERPWMTAMHRSALACTSDCEGQPPEGLIGANMGFARAVLERVPAFDVELGPGALGFKDDTLFSWQLQRAGFRLSPVWGSHIEHHFEPRRLLRANFLDTARRRGLSDAYVRYHWKHEQIVDPARRAWRAAVWLAWYRLRHAAEAFKKEGCLDQEMSLLRKFHFFRQFAVEQKRPRNYEPYGLKKSGTPVTPPRRGTPRARPRREDMAEVSHEEIR